MKKIIALFAIELLCSCSKPVNIVVVSDSNDEGKNLIVNKKDTLTLSGYADTLQLSKYKPYTYTLNGAEGNFAIHEKGGILNLGKKEFVVLAIDYESEGKLNSLTQGAVIEQPNYAIIHSYLVFKSVFADRVEDETALNRIIDSVLASPTHNYTPPLFPEEKFRHNLDREDYVFGFKKIGSDRLFIEKFWDYNLGEEIPETIEVHTRSNNPLFNSKTIKKAIFFADQFLLMIQLGFDDYTALDISKQLEERENTNPPAETDEVSMGK